MSLPYDTQMAQVAHLQEELERAKAEAERIRRQCQHVWGEVRYTPDYQPAYTIPGDPPGTMGVDWRGPCHVSATTTHKWTRKCSVCGYTQTTTRKKLSGYPLQQEEPDFGDTR